MLWRTCYDTANDEYKCCYITKKGVVGVASAGPDFYVIALADSSVQHGALVGRLRTLSSHVKESLSQLD